MSTRNPAVSRWHFRVVLAAAAAAVLAFAALPAEAATAPGPGNDVSWPQCGKALPKGQTFGIVGVNNGLANTTNPCLGTQLTWAGTSKGGTGQPLVALYVNTANPGASGSWWPMRRWCLFAIRNTAVAMVAMVRSTPWASHQAASYHMCRPSVAMDPTPGA